MRLKFNQNARYEHKQQDLLFSCAVKIQLFLLWYETWAYGDISYAEECDWGSTQLRRLVPTLSEVQISKLCEEFGLSHSFIFPYYPHFSPPFTLLFTYTKFPTELIFFYSPFFPITPIPPGPFSDRNSGYIYRPKSGSCSVVCSDDVDSKFEQ